MKNMDEETKNRLADYFESETLVELLGIPCREIIDRFEEEIAEKLEAIEELMGVLHE